jgi:hypothetical protein
MAWVFIVVAAIAVFCIAAVVIGRESRLLAGEPPRPVFEFEEAVDWVAAHLPYEVAAVLSHDDVGAMLGWYLEYLRAEGISTNGDGSEAPVGPVIVGGSEAIDHVLRRASEAGLEIDARQAHAVIDAQMAYMEAIGAVGPPTPPDEVPPPPG